MLDALLSAAATGGSRTDEGAVYAVLGVCAGVIE